MDTPTPTSKPVRKWVTTIHSFLLFTGVIILAGAVFLTILSSRLCGCASRKDVARIFVTSEVDIMLQAYKADTGSFPTTRQGLLTLIAPANGVKGWKGPYITTTSVPLDPWGNPYHYAYPSTHGQAAGKYDCWSLGPDGLDGTADDIGNWPTS